MGPMPPQSLLVLQGERSMATKLTIEQLYHEHKQFVYQTALRFTRGRRDCAEDVAQTVFLRASRHLDTLADVDEPRAWLYTVTLRAALTELRNESSWYRRLANAWRERDDDRAPDLSRQLQASDQAQRALAALGTLPPLQQMVAVMAFVDQTPQTDIAKELGLSEAKVSRVLTAVREHLAKQGWRAP